MRPADDTSAPGDKEIKEKLAIPHSYTFWLSCYFKRVSGLSSLFNSIFMACGSDRPFIIFSPLLLRAGLRRLCWQPSRGAWRTGSSQPCPLLPSSSCWTNSHARTCSIVAYSPYDLVLYLASLSQQENALSPPNSIYRGTPDMYLGDAMSGQVVMRAIFKSKIMDDVHPAYRLFPCLALSHQEDLDMQRLCISEWTRATHYFEADDPVMAYTDVFKKYALLVGRFFIVVVALFLCVFMHVHAFYGRAPAPFLELDASKMHTQPDTIACQDSHPS